MINQSWHRRFITDYLFKPISQEPMHIFHVLSVSKTGWIVAKAVMYSRDLSDYEFLRHLKVYGRKCWETWSVKLFLLTIYEV